MANTWLTASWVARKSLVLLHSKAQAAMACNRNYESAIGAKIDGVPLGTSYNVRRPFQFTLRTGPAMAAQNLNQVSSTLTLNQQNGCDVNLTSIERQFDIGDFEEQIIRPASARIASGINANVTALVTQIPKQVGTSSTTVTFANILQAAQYLNQALAPDGDDRTLLINPTHQYDFINNNQSLYNPQVEISDQWREGVIASRVAGFLAMSEPKVAGYTTGTFGSSTPVVKSGTSPGITGSGNAYASTTTLSTTGWASGASTLNAGDVFTISGVYDVDPETHASLGRLKQFTVTAQISDTSGEIDAVISPALIYGGAYQSVTGASSAITSGSAIATNTITMASASASSFSQSIAMYKDAILFACVPLVDASELVKFYAQEQFDGFSMRVIQTYDTNNDLLPLRLDTISGEVLSCPDLAVKIVGL